MERFFGSLKREQTDHYTYGTRQDVMKDVVDYILFYNNHRLHSYLGYNSPVNYERKSLEMVSNFQGVGKVSCGDMTDTKLYPHFDVCILCLALMFTDVSRRNRFILSLKEKVKQGGVIIILDKIEPPAGYMGTCISRMSIKNKYDSGVKAKAIIEKELSLCGAQRPTAESFFSCHGFQSFFKIGDFVGYIYEEKIDT